MELKGRKILSNYFYSSIKFNGTSFMLWIWIPRWVSIYELFRVMTVILEKLLCCTIIMLMTFFVMLVIFSIYYIGHQHLESVTNISNLSPTHLVSNIDVTIPSPAFQSWSESCCQNWVSSKRNSLVKIKKIKKMNFVCYGAHNFLRNCLKENAHFK